MIARDIGEQKTNTGASMLQIKKSELKNLRVNVKRRLIGLLKNMIWALTIIVLRDIMIEYQIKIKRLI